MDKLNKLRETLEKLITDMNKNGEPSLIKLVFGDTRKKSLPYKKVTLRPVKIGGSFVFQAEYSYENKVIHENLSAEEACTLALTLIVSDFKQINAFTEEGEMQVLAARPDNPKIIERKKASDLRGKVPEGSSCASASCAAGSECTACNGTSCASDTNCASNSSDRFAHNRSKKRIIPDGVPCDFLIRLGVMDKDGRVYKKHYAKYRQINRYLEIVDDALCYLPETDRPLRIIDFGCGKAYLTFALYYYLKVLHGRNVEIVGLDLKENVIEFCSEIARDLGYTELKFLLGDIADYTNDHADMVVTLHACDTATDYALINAVSWNAPVILSVPCCQHELFKQIDDPLHEPMYKHGILKDRFTEILTDGLRALKLEEAGYKVSLIEFTSLEHTARNIMIRAVKDAAADAENSDAGAVADGGSEKQIAGANAAADGNSQKQIAGADAARREKAAREYEALRDFYHVSPTIDKMVIK